jgi:hypothetical protein
MSDNDSQTISIENYKKMSVAFSRARIGLYIFGNFDCFEKELKTKNEGLIWLNILKLAKDKKIITNSIDLICETHKKITKI